MTGVEAYLSQLDDAWEHKWESVRAVLDGVSEEEAAWQPPCYAAEEREQGWPPPGTIGWQVAHIAHCKRHYALFIRAPESVDRPPAPERTPRASLEEERAELDAAHTDLRTAVAALEETDLQKVVGNGMRMDEFLAMITRHDTWHAGQIAVARRLYRTRPSG